jgi:serine/threonine-protein kinase RsbW
MNASLTIEADLVNLSTVRDFITEHARKVCTNEGSLYGLALAVDEAVTNIIVHGYQGQPGKIHILLKIRPAGLDVILRDEAPPFDPTRVPAPDIQLPLEERGPGGLGVFLARELTDRMLYRRLPKGGNELKLVKWCPHTNNK